MKGLWKKVAASLRKTNNEPNEERSVPEGGSLSKSERKYNPSSPTQEGENKERRFSLPNASPKKSGSNKNKNNNSNNKDHNSGNDSDADQAIGDSGKQKIKELPGAALKVFKSSGLTDKQALEHWTVFLNCLYYTTPKKTFPRAPPAVPVTRPQPNGNSSITTSNHSITMGGLDSTIRSGEDLSESSELELDLGPLDSKQWTVTNELKENSVVLTSESRDQTGDDDQHDVFSTVTGDEEGDDERETAGDSSTLDSDFDPQLVSTHINKQPAKSPRPQRKKKKHYSKEELAKLVVVVNPKDLYANFREIGKGAYGKVYIATKKDNKKKVAIKHMQRAWDTDADSIANEIVVLDSCHHDNIVNYITSYLHQNKIWMVMEYCDAGTLKQLLVIEMSEGQIANVVKQVLKGISYLHSLKRIHRDIKSSNILLNMNGDVKVADLGLCIEGEGEQTGMAGSKYWMAPEMIKRQTYSFKVDVWSIGALTMEMAEGNPPYYNYKPLKALFYTATKGAPTLKKPEKWSETFKDFLAQCFQVEPTSRPSSAELLEHPFMRKACEKKELIKALKLVFLMRVTAGL